MARLRRGNSGLSTSLLSWQGCQGQHKRRPGSGFPQTTNDTDKAGALHLCAEHAAVSHGVCPITCLAKARPETARPAGRLPGTAEKDRTTGQGCHYKYICKQTTYFVIENSHCRHGGQSKASTAKHLELSPCSLDVRPQGPRPGPLDHRHDARLEPKQSRLWCCSKT